MAEKEDIIEQMTPEAWGKPKFLELFCEVHTEWFQAQCSALSIYYKLN